MRGLLLSMFAWLALCLPGHAQMLQSIVNAKAPAASGGYTGPGDIVSGATFWVSCTRAYSASYASSGGNACQLSRASDSTTCIVKVAAAGNVDYTVGTPCAGSTTATTWCGGTTCSVNNAYDQTGNGNTFAHAAGAAPTINLTGINSHPAMVCGGAGDLVLTSLSQSQPFTIMSVASRTANYTTALGIIVSFTTGTGLYTEGSANTATTYAGGSNLDAAASDNSPHVLQAVLNGTNSGSGLNVDGSLTAATSGAPGTGGTSGNLQFCGNGVNTLIGYLAEGGLWPSAFTSGNQSSQHTNASAFYATP